MIYALLFFVTILKNNAQIQVVLSSWQFRQAGTEVWHPAFVPGNVVTDLFKNKLIGDPFYSDNEKKLQWIENDAWEYQASLQCDTAFLRKSHIDLIFEGLDTYAKIYLNDSLILSANNMFRLWKSDIKKYLGKGNNKISVIFESAVKKGSAEASKLLYTLPEGERVFTRKAQFQYGWDFGPRFAACGIWKPIKLVAWDEVKIESVHYEIKSITDSIAKVDLILETISSVEDTFHFVVGQQRGYGIKIPGAKKGKIFY